ncbi:hypothetical protein [Tenacibaculum soleae]|uniref:hypothetical protein n=1 Tax=Tenacibaculum soleae TaxID=447689 RepID=UPI0022FFD077|nr:hypothetical protein [Tenacibaculum soleae]
MKKKILINGDVYIAEPVNEVFNDTLEAGEDYLYMGDLTMLNIDPENDNDNMNDFYEEGEFSPLVSGVLGADYEGAVFGYYKRVGNLVNVMIKFSYPAFGGVFPSDNFFIKSLPFSPPNYRRQALNIVEFTGTSLSSDDFYLLVPVASDGVISFMNKNGGLAEFSIVGDGDCIISGSYFIDDFEF